MHQQCHGRDRSDCASGAGTAFATPLGMTHASYEVVPKNGGWMVQMPGDSVSEWHASKDDAVRRARELGRAYDTWRVRVLTDSGAVEQELTSAAWS